MIMKNVKRICMLIGVAGVFIVGYYTNWQTALGMFMFMIGHHAEKHT